MIDAAVGFFEKLSRVLFSKVEMYLLHCFRDCYLPDLEMMKYLEWTSTF